MRYLLDTNICVYFLVIVQLQREGKKVCENFTKKGLKKNTNEIKWVHGCIQ